MFFRLPRHQEIISSMSINKTLYSVLLKSLSTTTMFFFSSIETCLLVVSLFREAGKAGRASVRSQAKGDIEEDFSESSSESEEEEESQDRRQVS